MSPTPTTTIPPNCSSRETMVIVGIVDSARTRSAELDKEVDRADTILENHSPVDQTDRDLVAVHLKPLVAFDDVNDVELERKSAAHAMNNSESFITQATAILCEKRYFNFGYIE